jgi:adenosine deaminase
MDFHTFLRKLPKVELHCHLEGSVKASTLVELAAKHGIQLPPYEQPEDLYEFATGFDFLNIYELAAHSMRDYDDFRRVTYETLEEGVASGLRYREMFWSPMAHMDVGVPYQVAIDGIIAGIRDAERDMGVQCRLIADINRMESAARGLAMVETVLENRRDELIGIGLDYAEAGNPPEKFVEAYRLAAKGGLHLTAHACEMAPAINVVTCLDLLGVERIDHGYLMLDDEEVVQRCLDEEIVFAVTPSGVEFGASLGIIPQDSIRKMALRGLKIMINSDDPAMLKTNLGQEYIIVAEMGFGPADFRRFVLNGIDGSWLDESTKRQWRQEWSREIDELEAQLD